MFELSVEQADLISGGSEKSYNLGREVGKTMAQALKYAALIGFLAGAAATA
ncbi:MAG: hypothetical protein WA956_11475 [Stenotrophomonas sp.]